ncbi:MAG: Xaa-Pro peptidase family protein [Solirubrobacterales bacterium]|nr:Xaa-Pro peptidase family protein [Solirubrobacterales bacterium]
MSEGERVAAVARLLGERELDALLVSGPANVRYLSNYTGSNGLALIASTESARPHLFLTDFRYATQAEQQVPGCLEREISTGDLLESVCLQLRGWEGGDAQDGGQRRAARRLGFDDAHLTVAQHRRLGDLLEGASWELEPCGGLVESLREIKDPEELRRIGAAAQLADEALRAVLERGLAGRSEREVAIALELQMRRLGAEGPSFPAIVAAGAHGALPHAEPRDAQIPVGVLVTIDWGATLDGYCSDCTRTFAVGHADGLAREVYELVLAAQRTGLDALRAGRSGREVDADARAVIERAGYGEQFGHGLGHGVGIEVHEAPRLSRTAPEEQLVRAGTVVTVEPGVYLPGRVGVRIEDLVSVTAEGCRVLNGLSKELTVLD